MSITVLDGSNTEYRVLHAWVQRKLGAPQYCENCGDTSPRSYDWANKSGLYLKDLNDWIRLCRPCHRAYDNKQQWKEYCIRGHKLVLTNIFLAKHRYIRCCQCRYEDLMNFKQRSKQMTIQVKSSSRAYKIVVRLLPSEQDDHYDVTDPGEREFFEDLFGRGPGDPDFHTPPWEAEDVA